MKCTISRIAIVAAAFAASGSLGMARSAGAQGAAPKPDPVAKPIPRMPDGHPNLNGVWWPGQDVGVTNLTVATGGERPKTAPPLGPLPGAFGSLYKPEYMAKAKIMGDKEDPTLQCIPSILGQGLVIQLIQTPQFVAELNETFHGFRVIPTDNRPHADDFAPSNKGDGVGHWDGDTLVVDVTNFSTANWLHDHGNVSFHSDKLHEVQTYKLLDADMIEISATFDDSVMLTGPWTTKKTWRRAPFDRVMETFCSGVETKPLIEFGATENYGRTGR
jgi:hypothetical protein